MSDKLNSLITRTLADSDLSDPRAVAALVASATPEDDIRAFYATALVGTVRQAMSTQRNRALSAALRPIAPNRSAKVAGIRDWWAELCAARVHVGDSKWTTLGECSAAELQFAAKERREAADREVARAAMYDELRSLLRTHRVRTVAELPSDAKATIQQVAA